MAQGNSNLYAAGACFQFKFQGYKDWYLPSKDELNQLFIQRNIVGNFQGGSYWSSSEIVVDSDYSLAWTQDFFEGYQIKTVKYNTAYVRPIRSF